MIFIIFSGLSNPASNKIYMKLDQNLHKCFEILEKALAKVLPIVAIMTKFVTCFIVYSATDLGAEAFELPMPGRWWVFWSIFALNIRDTSRSNSVGSDLHSSFVHSCLDVKAVSPSVIVIDIEWEWVSEWDASGFSFRSIAKRCSYLYVIAIGSHTRRSHFALSRIWAKTMLICVIKLLVTVARSRERYF